MELLKSNKMFGGFVRRYRHRSEVLGCDMHVTVFTPPAAEGEAGAAVPVVYYLSGLTCTDENFMQKAGAQRAAAALGLALVAPDTSPRGLGIEGEDDSYDFGTGAGFYLDATEGKWRQYRMYTYITAELPALLRTLPRLDVDNAGIMGHSMGGHGALTIALRNPGAYKSVSAFAPICNPSAVPWGQKAFDGYLGPAWREAGSAAAAVAQQHDATQLAAREDEYLTTQLHPSAFEAAAAANAGLALTSRLQPGYDHSYFFIATFVDEHLAFHARHLGAAASS